MANTTSAASSGSILTPAYGPAPGIAKLNANENPYGPSPAALRAMAEASRNGAYYVSESVPRLKAMIAEKHNITPEHIMLSAGSSGVLTYLAVAASKRGKIVVPDLYWDTTTRMALRQSGGSMLRLPKTDDLQIDLAAMEAAIDDNVAMVHVTNPNNPTGRVLPPDQLAEFCKRTSKKVTVLLDEAYNELTEDPDASTMVPLIKSGHDILVARTFSKIYGLAGMRVGYLIGPPERIAEASVYGLGDYALNQAGVAAAVASYDDEAFLQYSKSNILEAREMVTEALKRNDLRALPSSTNFMFVDLGNRNAEAFRQAMASRGVLIRGIYRDYINWSRVSMGLLQDVEKYVAALPPVLDEIETSMV
ncbi:MAG: histidinol-phosphate transaminase [Pseudomonadota bacterium]